MRIRRTDDFTAMARDRRVELGWSPEELAGRVGMPEAWVADLETGKASVDLTSALRLLDVLGIHLEAGFHGGTELPQWSGGVVDLDQVLTRYLESAPPEPPEPESPASGDEATDDGNTEQVG